MQAFQNIRVVLVETSHPGNIGAAARAMKTMGLARLYLVRPRSFPDVRATARAAGAGDILATAVMCDSLDAALHDTVLAVGTSARPRGVEWPRLNARESARRIVAESGEVALVFGRERSGLTNQELDRCHYAVSIPCNPAYRSLNLAAAVQVVCYELMMCAHQGDLIATGPQEPPAPAAELELFYAHLERTLIALEFLDPASPRQLMRRLRRLFSRARPTRNEVNILRGILTAARGRSAD
ncbi:MAG: RNA methyltransferase [Gammaproteobacteria bacterium]